MARPDSSLPLSSTDPQVSRLWSVLKTVGLKPWVDEYLAQALRSPTLHAWSGRSGRAMSSVRKGPYTLTTDVATQQSSQWPLSKWADYVKARSDPATSSSSKVYNIISLEISGTDLAKDVKPPSIVSDIDWVENFWPFPGGKEATMRAAAKEAGEASATAEPSPKGKAKSEWPKVQLYCLVCVVRCDTDARWA